MKLKTPQPKSHIDDVIPPPSSVTVEAEPRIVLFKADGTPLKRQIGYRP